MSNICSVLLFLLLIGGSTISYGAPKKFYIKGTIVSKDDKLPLPGASVVIHSLKKGVVTDKNGSYQLLVPEGKHSLYVSYIGFASIRKEVKVKGNDKTVDIVLSKTTKELSDVVVNGTSVASSMRENALPISVISMDEIKGSVGDVNDVLSRTAGVKIRRTGAEGASSRLSVRGLEGKRIGYYIEGMPMNDNADFLDLNDIPVDMIERIEVYKGVVPARFGGSSIGGAVNIVTKEYPEKYMDAAYSFGSYNTHKMNCILKRNNKKRGFEYGIGGWYTTSDNNYEMELPLEPGHYVTRSHDKFVKKVLAGGMTFKRLWFDEIVFEPSYTNTKKEIQGITGFDIQGAYMLNESYVLSNKFKKSDFLVKNLYLDIANNIGCAITQFKDTANARYDFNGTKYPAVHALGGEVGVTPNDSYNKKYIGMQKTNLNYELSSNHNLNLNSVYNYAYNIPQDTLEEKARGYRTNFNSRMNSYIAGLALESSTNNKRLVNAFSVKYYYYSMNSTLAELNNGSATKKVSIQKQDWGISDGVRFRFNPYLLVKASLAYDVRIPSESELLGDGFLITPAVDLVPERNTSANLGWMYERRNSSGNLFSLELNTFYMYLIDMIRFTGGPLQSIYQNFGRMRTLGMEAEIKWDVTNHVYLFANGTYQDLRDDREYGPNSTVANFSKGARMPNIPYLFFNCGFDLHKENLFGGRGQNTRLYSELSFVEEYYRDFKLSNFQEKIIPRATTVQLGLEHSLFNGGVILSFQVNNLTNAKVISEFNRPLPGRNFNMKIRYIWK
ncbi:TonB-dependent receptor plug domain-containing protein [Halosquirtibacter laminarini]|uniref:TonB-dependent receptor plug domain-containing protein n=1 Tax=Halosquirtibacter laminarini TaxID=3374600 RepID=A0AC61NI27_9BACT|nr:TonB-dependent receptor plug domain-containing protein [Prolixibacteraceae bacterium]